MVTARAEGFATDNKIGYLTVPGLAGSDAGHWQTIWEHQYPLSFARAEQENWDWPVRGQWVAALQQALERQERPVILVGHSLGCITIAHWCEAYASEKVAGALLVAPADTEECKRLAFVEGFTPIPRHRLPFPAYVVASTNDIYMSIDRSEHFAEKWGCKFINVGEKGHINAVSGLAAWPEGQDMLRQLTEETLQRRTA